MGQDDMSKFMIHKRNRVGKITIAYQQLPILKAGTHYCPIFHPDDQNNAAERGSVELMETGDSLWVRHYERQVSHVVDPLLI